MIDNKLHISTGNEVFKFKLDEEPNELIDWKNKINDAITNFNYYPINDDEFNVKVDDEYDTDYYVE